MTPTTATADRAPIDVASRPSRVTLPRVIASEWTKLRSLRSSWWTVLVAVAAMIGLSALFATSIAMTGDNSFGPGGPLAVIDGVSISLNGVMLAQLAFGILGVLMITSEYASGTITASLAAVPQRWPLLASKAAILTGLTLIVGLASSFGAFSLGQTLLAGTGIEVTVGEPGVIRAVTGASVYLAIVTLLGLGLGAHLRHTAGGIALLVGVLLLLGPLSAALPSSWQDTIGPYLPAAAGEAMMAVTQAPGTLNPEMGFAVFAGYAVATLVTATILLLRRDA